MADCDQALLREAAVRVAHALGPCDEATLLARARDAQRDARVEQVRARDRVALGMPLALLRPLRLLGVTGCGPKYVAEVPFPHVDAAIAACVRLGEAGGLMRGWIEREALGGWGIDAPAWRRRLRLARDNRGALGSAHAFAVCQGRIVVATRACEMPAGPLDGADATELIFDDGSTAVLALDGAPAGALLGAQLAASHIGRNARWRFATPRRGQVSIALVSADGVVVQPSPLADGAVARRVAGAPHRAG